MHRFLSRQLERHGLVPSSLPTDEAMWRSFIEKIDLVLEQAEDDRELLERSLALSSEEMGELHARLANERDILDSVICSLDEGVCAIGTDCTLMFVNPEASRILKLPPDAPAVGKPLGSLTDARLANGTTLVAALSSPSSIPPPGSRLIVGEDETTRIECTATQLARSEEHWVVTLRDVTDRARLEADRAALNSQLLEVSRRAGMAEVATCVLHNVGNVLNSVNVSATLITDKVRGSEARTLGDIASILPEEPEALARFVTEDDRGKLVPSLLRELGNHLCAERDSILTEAQQLGRNIDHIREIVSSQQSHARTTGIAEDVNLSEIIAEALRLNEQSLRRHGIEVETRLEATPRVRVEPNKVLQVLVNLIGNAKNALETTTLDQRTVRIRLYASGDASDPRAVIDITDNGEGIDPAHLDRLFEHGFTTRSEGHGFGLHYCALTAQQIGGTLEARSDGRGRGATFVLEIPTMAKAVAT